MLFSQFWEADRSQGITLLQMQQLRGHIEHFQSTSLVWRFVKHPADLLLGCSDETGLYIRCPDPIVWRMFWDTMDLIWVFHQDEREWRKLFMGKLVRLLPPEERLPIPSQRENAIWLSVDATLSYVAGISWKDKEAFRFPTSIIQDLIGIPTYPVVIGECELTSAVLAIVLWGLRGTRSRIVILCTDNINVFQWLDSAKSHGLVTSPLLRLLLQWCIEMGVEIIPHYIRSAHNVAADSLTRWSQYECEQWAIREGFQFADLPELWLKWELEWTHRAEAPSLSTFELLAPLYDFYQSYRVRVVEWRSHLHGTSRILSEQGIPSQCMDIQNRVIFQNLPDIVTEYTYGDVFLLIGNGGCKMDMDDFKLQIDQLSPRYAVFMGPGWVEDNENPSFWSDILTVDTGAFGDVIVGNSNMFCYGGFNRNHCDLEPHAHVFRTLSDAYHSAGFKIDSDPDGYRQIREIEGRTGSVVSIVTGNNQGVYAGDSHIPFPNTPVLRGIGLKWPTCQSEPLTYCQRAVVLGADFGVGHITDIPRSAIEYAVVNSPPLCLYRHVLWGASRHFAQNLPDLRYIEGRAGGQVTFNTENVVVDPASSWLGFVPKQPTTSEFFPALLNHVMGEEKLNALLSGIAPSTERRYLSVWNQWSYFMTMRQKDTWLVKTGPNWDADLIDFIMFESRLMKNTSDSIRVKVSAIRFWHIVCGLDDFTKFGGRYQQVLKGMRREHKTNRKIPFSVDMIDWIYTHYLAVDMANTARAELYAATVIGFFFLLRVGELENLRRSDVTLAKDENNDDVITVIIRHSKTDQYNAGNYKTLKAIPGPLCPVKAVARLITLQSWEEESDGRVFGKWLRNRLSAILRLAGSAIGVPASRVGNHSLRSGGATAMWRAGYDIEVIKRWGRWKSASF